MVSVNGRNILSGFGLIRIFLFTMLLCDWSGVVLAQNVSIKVTADETGEALEHAAIQNLKNNSTGITDDAGIGRIKAMTGDSLHITYVGYRDTTFVIPEDLTLYEIGLRIKPMETVVIFSEERFNRKASLGQQDVPMEFLKAVPSLTGDADILKTITFLPGVSEGREGYSHLLVRGGAQDENQILYDGATLFNVNHFGGFISMFHSEMIHSVDFYKSYWPSQFGGRLSSVMDVRSERGSFKEHKQTVDIGLIYSKALAQGPLWKDKLSYSVGGRRTFIDLITGPLSRKAKRGDHGSSPNIIVGDLNGRIDYRIKENQFLSVSGIHVLDKISFYEGGNSTVDEQYRIRNRALALNYSYYLDRATTIRIHGSFSDYFHHFDDEIIRKEIRYVEVGKPELYRTQFQNRYSGNSIQSKKIVLTGETSLEVPVKINYGLDFETMDYNLFLDRSESQKFKDSAVNVMSSFSERVGRSGVRTFSVFGDAEYSVNARWRIKGGIRLPRYENTLYKKWLPEPKVLTSLDLTEKSTVNASYNFQQQNLHLLGFTDLVGYYREFYITAEEKVAPSNSHQWSMGYFRSFDRMIDNLSIELYYKRQHDLSYFIPSVDEDLSVLNYPSHMHKDGTNQSYGMEVLLQKTKGDFHGSIAYTFSHSELTFETLNGGRSFDADFDYRHSTNILLLWKFGNGYKLAGQWSYKSGRPFTVSGSYVPKNDFLTSSFPFVAEMNNYRMPSFHRLDLSLDREWITKRKEKKNWFGLSLYNAYNRINPFFVAAEGKDLKVYGFFPLIPSFHFGFEL